jgi:hypothetical protein
MENAETFSERVDRGKSTRSNASTASVNTFCELDPKSVSENFSKRNYSSTISSSLKINRATTTNIKSKKIKK